MDENFDDRRKQESRRQNLDMWNEFKKEKKYVNYFGGKTRAYYFINETLIPSH